MHLSLCHCSLEKLIPLLNGISDETWDKLTALLLKTPPELLDKLLTILSNSSPQQIRKLVDLLTIVQGIFGPITSFMAAPKPSIRFVIGELPQCKPMYCMLMSQYYIVLQAGACDLHCT